MSAPQKHIILSDTKESKKFSPVTGGGNENLPHYNPFEHGKSDKTDASSLLKYGSQKINNFNVNFRREIEMRVYAQK